MHSNSGLENTIGKIKYRSRLFTYVTASSRINLSSFSVSGQAEACWSI